MNKKTMRNITNLMSSATNDEARMYHPVGPGCSNAMAAILDHELGHLLDYNLEPCSSSEIIKLCDDCRKYGMKTNLSDYAEQKGAGEFVTEAWGEYDTNPKPRDTVKKVGELIEREYRKRYGPI